MSRPPMNRRLRALLIVIAVLIVLPVAAAGVVVARFDPASLKPRIIAAVQRATGRQLTLAGPLRLHLAASPAIEADDVALANLPGGSRPQMVRIARLDVRVALLPLLTGRVVIDGLTLLHPDILLERGPDGQGNWLLRPPPGPPNPNAVPSAPSRPTRLEVRQIDIQDGTVTWRDRRGQLTVLAIDHLQARQPDAEAPLSLTGEIAAHGLPIAAQATTGPLPQMMQADATWPLQVSLAGAGAQAAIHGTIGGGGGRLHVEATIPDLTRLAPLLPHARLPPLHALTLAGDVLLAPGAPPVVSAVSLHAGPSGALLPGVSLSSLDLHLADLQAPADVAARAELFGVPVALDGTIGPLPAGRAPVPVALTARAPGASLAVKGLAGRKQGTDATVALRIADLAARGAPTGHSLPDLHDIALDARVTAQKQGVALHGLVLRGPPGDLSGEAGFALPNGRPDLTLALHSDRLDLDAIRAVLRQALPAPAPAAAPASAPASGASPAAAPPAAPNQAPGSPPAAVAPARVIPDTRLPFPALRDGDADIRLDVATLHAGGIDWHALATHLVLAGGRLTVDPFSITAPGGPVQGSAVADATASPPAAALRLSAAKLAIGPALAAFGLPPGSSGDLAVDADLRGTGDTPRALAAGLDGTLSLLLTGGEVQNALLTDLLGDVLRASHLPLGAAAGGRTDIHCLDLHAIAAHGVVTLQQLALATSRLDLHGEGSVNLAEETLDLQAQSLLRLGGTAVGVPVKIGGTLRAPRAELASLSGGRGVGLMIGAPPPPGEAGACAASETATRVDPRELLRKLFR